MAGVVVDDLADLSLLLEVGESTAGEGTVDLEAIDKGGDGYKAVGLDILLELVVGSLVEDDGVLSLVLDCGSGCMSVNRSFFFLLNPDRRVCAEVVLDHVEFAYPCPWTTSSSASLHRLLRVPNYSNQPL